MANISTSSIRFPTGAGDAMGFLAWSEDTAALPGLIVLQEFWGLNEHIKDVTERLASEGFAALAPDMYDGRVTTDPTEARQWLMALDPAEGLQKMNGAVEHLKSTANVDKEKIGVIGFCMGGRLTYLAAAHHANDVKAAVPYYGGGITMGNPSPLSRTGEIKCPMYLFFGAKDQLIPMDQVGQINTELTTKKVPFQMKIYPEAGHGFFCDERGSYHEASAKDAWEKTKSFFAQHLK